MNTNYNTLSQGAILHSSQYNYKIEKVLGQGTFGITYLAKVSLQGQLGQIDSNVYVSIKEFFMHEINGREGSSVTFSSSNKGGLFFYYKEKFAREAKNLSKLKHPNIVNVMDYFETNNTCYYVMEYLSGGDLDTLIAKQKRLGEVDTIRYAKQIGTALSFMHKNKMLHLDLKPKNVMLNATSDAILIDFGLSKQYDKNGEPESSTTVGRGTPGYAPLEQANYQDGHGFPVTMDVYALGATIYKMLTGVRPPEASVILNEGFNLAPLLAKYRVSIDILEVIRKAMSPLKKDRYQTVGDLINDLPDISSYNHEETIPKESKHGNKKADRQQNKKDPNPSTPKPINKETKETTNKASIWNKIVTRISGMNRTTRFFAPLIIGIGFAIFVYNVWVHAHGAPDADGVRLRSIFYIITFLLIPTVVFWKKEYNQKIIQGGIICLMASLVNSCLLAMWNGSLVDAYAVLSGCLALLSAFMLSKKTITDETKLVENDRKDNNGHCIDDAINDTPHNDNGQEQAAGADAPMSFGERIARGCFAYFIGIIMIIILALYDSRVADSIFDNNKYEEVGNSGKLRDDNVYTYYKVYDPDTKKWGVVKDYHEKGKKSHPNTEDDDIVLPIMYDSIHIDEEIDMENNWDVSYSCYGYKDGEMYDELDNKIDPSTLNK